MFGKKKNKEKEEKKETKKVDEALNEALDENKVKEEVKKEDKKQKEEKKASKPNNLRMGALAKVIGGILLVALGFIFIFAKSGTDSNGNDIYFREKVCLLVFGAISAIYGVLRLISVIKNPNTNTNVKLLLLIEVLVDVVIGVMLFVGGIGYGEESKGFNTFMLNNFKYFLGFVFYLKGLLYLISVVFLKHVTEGKEFIVNIVLLTFGAVIFARNEFDVHSLSWILVALSFICGAYTLGDGTYYYIKNKKPKENKEKTKTKEKEKDAKRDQAEEKIITPERDETTDSKYAN